MTRSRKLLLASAVASVGALTLAASAYAVYPHFGTGPEIKVSLVNQFLQCGTGSNPFNRHHSAPLAVPSCNPPKTTAGVAAVAGSAGAGEVKITVTGADVALEGHLTDVQTPAGAAYNPTPGAFGADLSAVARLRFTDTNNCDTPGDVTPPCETGTYTDEATGTDTDFGPVPINCEVGPPGPGSKCDISTTANSLVPGAVVPGKTANVQVFRIRVNDNTGKLAFHQGLQIP